MDLASSSYRRRKLTIPLMSSIGGLGRVGLDQPAVLVALLSPKIITKESGSDLEDGIWRYPRDIYASLMSERSIPRVCAVDNAERRVSSGVDGRVIELYGTRRLVPEVEVVSKEEMEGPTRPVQPDIVVMM